MAAFAALPLQWFIVASTPLGPARLHQAAILVFAALYFCRYRPSTIRPVLVAVWPFVLANVVMLGLWSVMQLYHGKVPSGPLQEIFYLGVFLAFSAMVFRAASGKDPEFTAVLRWTAGLASVTLLLALSYSMLRNGVSPPTVFAQTIRSADPEILQKELFRSAFTGFGYDEETVRGNIRHEVFGAILFAMYVSAWAARQHPFDRRLPRAFYQASMLLATILLVISLSRSIIIAAALWPLISLWRSGRSFTVTSRQVRITVSFIVVGAFAVISGFGLVVWNRFTSDTSSYQARQGLYSQALTDVRGSFFTGGIDTSGQSSHNFVLDALLRGGIFVALPAVVVLLYVGWRLLSLLLTLHLEPDSMVPIAAALVLPIVRLLTSGGGLINPVEWITLAFVSGVFAAHQGRATPRPPIGDDIGYPRRPVALA